jgi:TetR/AcrR family transcriptional regulator, regulator of cefoperazone and chloramphenicol sensitivity
MNIERLNEPVKGRRKYDSPVRREQAEATRRQIADAARRLFVERGWAGTRVRDVAAEAGVSEATVFSVHGNKAGLARALIDSVDVAADVPALISELQAAEGDPAGQIDAYVRFDRRLFEQGYDVLVLMREAERSEPDVAAAYRKGRRRGHKNQLRMFASWPAGAFRRGVTPERAAAVFASMCNVDVYRVLTEEHGWSADEVEEYWGDALKRLLLRDGQR